MLILDCDKNIRIFWQTFAVARMLFLNFDQVGSFFFTPTHCYQMFLDNTPCDNKYTGNKYISTSTKSWMFPFSFVWMRKSEAVSHQLGGGWWCQVFGLITKWGQPAIFNLLYMSDAPFGGGQCHAASCVVTAFDLRSSWLWSWWWIKKRIMRGWGIGVSHTVYFAKVIALWPNVGSAGFVCCCCRWWWWWWVCGCYFSSGIFLAPICAELALSDIFRSFLSKRYFHLLLMLWNIMIINHITAMPMIILSSEYDHWSSYLLHPA